MFSHRAPGSPLAACQPPDVSLASNMNLSVTDDISISGSQIPSFISYMGRSQESSMYLSNCTTEEIEQIIKDLENGKASDIPIKLIKRSSDVISPFLAQYFNDFMKKGEFQDLLKIGKITPVYKKDDQEKFENY